MDEKYWDTLFRSQDRIFSGNPNAVLVTEISGAPAGRALDVGCGEGGDALWLAEQGWEVTAADISSAALGKLSAEASARGLRVRTLHADLSAQAPPVGEFDLVTASFLPLRKDLGERPLRGLIEAVAPGGTLLVTSHCLAEVPDHEGHDGSLIRMADFREPSDFAPLLGPGWEVVLDVLRPRQNVTPDARHTKDAVFRARRVA